MANCEWTEKVSLLIDGELAQDEARAVETHLADCFGCRMAREDFLLLRHRISSYHADVNLLAQREALQNILDAGRPGNSTVRAVSAPGRRGLFSDLFALPRLNPGLVAASALLLVCLAVGLLMLRRESAPVEVAENPQKAATQQATGKTENVNAANVAPTAATNVPTPERNVIDTAVPAPTDEVAKFQPKGPGGVKGDKFQPKGVNLIAKDFRPKGPGSTNTDKDKYRPKGAAGSADLAKLPREVVDLPFLIPPRVDVEAREFSEAEIASAAEPQRAPAPAGLSAARHAEQAQQLLRSFRNAGATEVADLSYERQRSQTLLYQNIVLRREAARGGNAAVETTLTQLEPILLDIANLPEKPASEEVRSIRNRMEKKNIVAMLQVAARD